MNKMHMQVAVPIQIPPMELHLKSFFYDSYMFDTPSRFKIYTVAETEDTFCQDDHGSWYYLTLLRADSLQELKLKRQISHPAYMETNVALPLLDRLKELKLTIDNSSLDKAYAHTSILTSPLHALSPSYQLKVANVDGDDDPSIIRKIHMVKNRCNGLETRFISGFETNSFATITENQDFYDNIHLNVTSHLYLLYFIYYMKYQFIPSAQMMPRFLGNLWASTRAFSNNWNKAMIEQLDF